MPQPPQLAASVCTLTHTLEQLVSDPQSRVQVPPAQKKPAEQALPQRPQCAALVAKLASQPLLATPSQLPKPAAQLDTAQAPAVQTGVALARLHARPQPPQWARVVPVFTSQPLAALRSQLPKPAEQVMPQVPALHVGEPLVALHARPQPPQWRTSLRWSTSHPLLATASQLAKPVVQLDTAQALDAHAGVALGSEHAAPHEPHEVTVLRRSTSQPLAALPSQLPKPAAQVMPHAPAAHEGVPLVALQALPQPPQWAGLVAKLVSQPLAALPSQSPKPALQRNEHAPLAHVAVALAAPGQLTPQAPQLAGLVCVLTHAPEQNVVPDPHTDPHTPALHTKPAPQALLQRPQWALLLVTSVSQPLTRLPSQLP